MDKMKVCAQKSVAARAALNSGAQNLMICFAGGIVLRLAGPVLAVSGLVLASLLPWCGCTWASRRW